MKNKQTKDSHLSLKQKLSISHYQKKYGILIKKENNLYSCFFDGCNIKCLNNFSRHIHAHEKNHDSISEKYNDYLLSLEGNEKRNCLSLFHLMVVGNDDMLLDSDFYGTNTTCKICKRFINEEYKTSFNFRTKHKRGRKKKIYNNISIKKSSEVENMSSLKQSNTHDKSSLEEICGSSSINSYQNQKFLGEETSVSYNNDLLKNFTTNSNYSELNYLKNDTLENNNGIIPSSHYSEVSISEFLYPFNLKVE